MGLGPAPGRSEPGGADQEPRARAQAVAEPSSVAAGPPPPRGGDMNPGREPGAPRTPFRIADILGPRTVPRAPFAPQLAGSGASPKSPLCALEELTSNTFRGPDGRAPQPSQGRAAPDALGSGPAGRRRRKSRTAFTAQQVLELERRFVFQKYLAPSEREGLAARLGLANAQVVTWFQNRRAKLKRDVEELRADVASLRALSPGVLCRLALPDGDPGSDPGPGPGPGPRPCSAVSDSRPHLSDEEIQVDD